MLSLIHTATTAIDIATPVTVEIAKSYTRPRPLFKTLVTFYHIFLLIHN